MSDIESWTADDVVENLTQNGHGEVAPVFEENEITGGMLPFITEEHLKDMGITSIGRRLLVLQYITELVGGGVAREAPPPAARPKPQSRPHVEFEDPTEFAPPPPGRGQKPAPAAASKPKPATAPPPDPESVPKYKRDHDKMVEQMRAARKYAAYEKAVQEGRATGPPPELAPIEEPEGLQPCPVCGRKFGEEAYRHHVPVCERMNAGRTPPVRSRGGRR
jgi:hypothetical protein